MQPDSNPSLIPARCFRCGKVTKRKGSLVRIYCSPACYHSARKATFATRAVEKLIALRRVVPETGCWEWTGVVLRNGYGATSYKGRHHMVHRVSAALYRGFDIDLPMFILHRCDNPPCFNPDHLFVGTPADNYVDSINKERQVTIGQKGQATWNGRFTPEQIVEIRRRSLDGEMGSKLAEEFGVARNTLSKIVLRKTWKHVA